MLFHVRMDVQLPHDLSVEAHADVLAREKAYSRQLQRSGKRPQLATHPSEI
ncbi:Muconolactone Delta-isomerase [Nocardia sp. RB20]|uniref:Muconolactone Delta-isomerase n=1 Tax=Nocardia macrotermitis TaxID=2585198 RepID=A0A7K0D979_9NOCA|nr:Muconolactone Delta-isomerase [Nocardia macrotermitis]